MSDNADAAPARKTPIESPTPESKPEPRAELTADQQAKFGAVLAKAKAFTEVQCPKEKDKSGPITDSEKSWLTRDCILRYLRATNWSVDEAASRLLDTLAWRREYGLDGFTADYISPEQETGKQIIVGYDRQARPCQYLNPGRQNTDASPRQIHHLFFMVERVIDMMGPGVEKLNLMINFKPSKTRSNTSVPISTAREVLHILQSHYPERLGKALIIHVPWYIWGFFKLIRPFMHPVTREKLKFNEDMRQYVPSEQLWSADWNGDLDFEYDHAVYWPALNDMCRRKRESRKARWVAAGSVIGESEDFLAGGTDESITGFRYADDKTEANSVDGLQEKLGGVELSNGTSPAAPAASA